MQEQEEIKPNGGAEFHSGALSRIPNQPSRRTNIIEKMPWRPFGEGKSPIQINVYPYALEAGVTDEVSQAAQRAHAEREALIEEEAALIKKYKQLETELFFDELDEKSLDAEENSTARKLKMVSDRLVSVRNTLKATPNGWYVRARDYFCHVIADKTIQIDDQEVAVTPEGMMHVEPILLLKLMRDLDDFFHGEKRLKKK